MRPASFNSSNSLIFIRNPPYPQHTHAQTDTHTHADGGERERETRLAKERDRMLTDILSETLNYQTFEVNIFLQLHFRLTYRLKPQTSPRITKASIRSKREGLSRTKYRLEVADGERVGEGIVVKNSPPQSAHLEAAGDKRSPDCGGRRLEQRGAAVEVGGDW